MIDKTLSLKAVFIVSIVGLLFSGYLSFTELFNKPCSFGCSAGDSGNLFGLPVCVYGFFMYLVIFAITTLGLLEKKQ